MRSEKEHLWLCSPFHNYIKGGSCTSLHSFLLLGILSSHLHLLFSSDILTFGSLRSLRSLFLFIFFIVLKSLFRVVIPASKSCVSRSNHTSIKSSCIPTLRDSLLAEVHSKQRGSHVMELVHTCFPRCGTRSSLLDRSSRRQTTSSNTTRSLRSNLSSKPTAHYLTRSTTVSFMAIRWSSS